MMAEKLYGPDVDRFRLSLIQQSRAILDRALAEVDRSQDVSLLQTIYEVWGMNLGALEGMACLRGLDRENRHRTLRTAVNKGKEALLQDCQRTGHPRLERLEQEINELN